MTTAQVEDSMPEIGRKEEELDPRLTTADLANLDESTSTRHDVHREKETDGTDGGRRATVSETASESDIAPLFSPEESKGLHARWDAIQVSFVDEPRQAVQQADGLVANAMKRLAEIFAEERSQLDQQWDRGSDVSTEDLRIALRRYRSFFGRLLSI
jgi:hypothetical protein